MMKRMIRLLGGPAPEATGVDASRVEILPFLSPKEQLILRHLIATGETYGLEMVKASNGELKRGTVYVTLDRMEDKGLITSRKDSNAPGDGPAKRMYMASGTGQRALAAMDLMGRSLEGGQVG